MDTNLKIEFKRTIKDKKLARRHVKQNISTIRQIALLKSQLKKVHATNRLLLKDNIELSKQNQQTVIFKKDLLQELNNLYNNINKDL